MRTSWLLTLEYSGAPLRSEDAPLGLRTDPGGAVREP